MFLSSGRSLSPHSDRFLSLSSLALLILPSVSNWRCESHSHYRNARRGQSPPFTECVAQSEEEYLCSGLAIATLQEKDRLMLRGWQHRPRTQLGRKGTLHVPLRLVGDQSSVVTFTFLPVRYFLHPPTLVSRSKAKQPQRQDVEQAKR